MTAIKIPGMNGKGIGSTGGFLVIKIASFIIIAAGMMYAKSIITPFLLAVFISIVCAQPISWLEKKRLPGWLAIVIVLLALMSLFSGFAFLIGGAVSSFSLNVAKYETTLTAISNSYIRFLNEKGVNIPVDQSISLVQPAKILEFTASALNGVLSMMGNTFLIFLIVLFILLESASFSDKAKMMLRGSDQSISYFSIILKNIRHYLAIKTLVCLLTGISIYLALKIIGVDYPLLWALIAALMNYIPNIGSIIAAVPAVLFALVQFGIGGALWTLGSFLLVNNVLGNFFEPRIMGRGLGLSTLVVFLSLLFWGLILGTAGMFLSVPLTMTIKIILEQNEKTRWVATLLGTPAEAKIQLQHLEQVTKKDHNKVV